jgi:putative hydrolase of the HAD superfamily
VDAVVFDLFGTLVAAPTSRERTQAASQLARVIGCPPAVVDRYFCDTWQARHDGTLPAVADLAAHLVRAVGGPHRAVGLVADELRTLGGARLVADSSVIEALETMRSKGLRLGVLSDASAEVVAAWPASPLALLVNGAVFSCVAGFTKPDPRLYDRIRAELAVSARRTLYVGDGGGDELRGAVESAMIAVAVRRRGPGDALVFGDTPWSGPTIDSVEFVPAYVAKLR